MLYNIVIGTENNSLRQGGFELEKNEHGVFLSNKSIRQKFRVFVNEEENAKGVEITHIFYEAGYTSSINVYDIKGNWKYINNNNNMNVMAIPNEEDYTAIFLTVGQLYQMYGYGINERIVLSYHDISEYIGCMIQMRTSSIIAGTKIASIKVKDRTNNKYYYLDITFGENKEIVVKESPIKSGPAIKKMRELDDRNKNRDTVLGFKVVPEAGKMMTATYITTSKNQTLARAISKGIKNSNIIVVPDDKRKVKGFLKSMIGKHRKIRAVTTVGFRLSPELIKELKLLYVFDYNFDSNTLVTVKSN